VSGSQLDADLVELFVERVLGSEDVAFHHADEAEFEAELEAESTARQAPPAEVAPAPVSPPALEAA
jgi:hypothetical protein